MPRFDHTRTAPAAAHRVSATARGRHQGEDGSGRIGEVFERLQLAEDLLGPHADVGDLFVLVDDDDCRSAVGIEGDGGGQAREHAGARAACHRAGQ